MYKASAAAAPREKVQLGKLDATLAERGGHEDSRQLAVPRARPSFDKLSLLSHSLRDFSAVWQFRRALYCPFDVTPALGH